MDTNKILREGDAFVFVVNEEDTGTKEPEPVADPTEAQAPLYTQTLVVPQNTVEAEVTEDRPDATSTEEYRQELDEGERG